MMFSIFALLAYVSFLFTGAYDQDILTMDRAERVTNREAIRNMLGLPGADLAPLPDWKDALRRYLEEIKQCKPQ